MSHREDKIKRMLPKTYQRNHVANEIRVALAFFKDLQPKIDEYVYNDGTTKNLMSLSGTIPVMYNEKSYNIPICLWLEESYPQTAPICYVRPTREMMVIRQRFISNTIEVVMPYLKEWTPGECNLVTLLQVLVATFGDFPPVCMQPHPQPEQDSCWQQFHREAQLFSRTDGSLYLYLEGGDGQSFQQENETNC